jgi:hypothetical protein
MAKGSDGATYKVMAYERMAMQVHLTHGGDTWEPTGVTEYHLKDGRLVAPDREGTLRIAGSNVMLTPSKELPGEPMGDYMLH